MKIPAGTQPGAEIRVRGRGIPHINSNRRGDLRVLVDLQVPRSLTAQQRKLLEELARSFESTDGSEDGSGKDHGKDKGLFERIKEVLG